MNVITVHAQDLVNLTQCPKIIVCAFTRFVYYSYRPIRVWWIIVNTASNFIGKRVCNPVVIDECSYFAYCDYVYISSYITDMLQVGLCVWFSIHSWHHPNHGVSISMWRCSKDRWS